MDTCDIKRVYPNLYALKPSDFDTVEVPSCSSSWPTGAATRHVHIFQRPLEVLRTSEAGCLGAAMYAGVGAGLYESCEQAAERAVSVVHRYEPDASKKTPYDESFARFVEVYDALNAPTA